MLEFCILQGCQCYIDLKRLEDVYKKKFFLKILKKYIFQFKTLLIMSRKIIGRSFQLYFFLSVFIPQVLFMKRSLPLTVYACNSCFLD